MSARVRWMLVAALVPATLPMPALAIEGAIEINQARALAGGVTPGDAPGFPVTIGMRGRYVLTGSLTPSDANTPGISIQSNDVTLDLNGFRIAGGTTCTGYGSTIVCAPQGSGVGIVSSGNEGITVRNGTVTGFPSHGIQLDPTRNCRIEGLTIAANAGSGLSLGGGCDVSGVIMDRNGAGGVTVGDATDTEPDTTVRESVISRNRNSGVGTLGSSDRFALLRSVVHGNGLIGVSLISQGTVRDCVIHGNGLTGLSVGEGHVRGNAVRSNARGFSFGALVGYVHNSFTDHASASLGGVSIGNHNFCIDNPGPFSFCP